MIAANLARESNLNFGESNDIRPASQRFFEASPFLLMN
jgi:hypothetical protein